MVKHHGRMLAAMSRIAILVCMIPLAALIPANANATSFGSCGNGIPVVQGATVVMEADVDDVQWYTLLYVHNLSALTASMLYNTGGYSLIFSVYDDPTCSTPICTLDLTTPTGNVLGCLELTGPHDPTSPKQYSIRMAYESGEGPVVYSLGF